LIVSRFKVPASWKVERSFDWGSTHPFSVGWWATANGESVRLPDGKEFCPTKGSIVRLAEWYGAKDIFENEGLRLGPAEIARGILEREKMMLDEGWIATTPKPGPADSQIYNVNDTESDSIGQRMEQIGVKWLAADKKQGSRVNGLQLVRQRMKASKMGEGMGIYFMDNCRAAIGTLPILPRDPIHVEDVDTKAIDHLFDETRYFTLYKAKEYATKLEFKFG